jgi:hypothetical protein
VKLRIKVEAAKDVFANTPLDRISWRLSRIVPDPSDGSDWWPDYPGVVELGGVFKGRSVVELVIKGAPSASTITLTETQNRCLPATFHVAPDTRIANVTVQCRPTQPTVNGG